MKKTIAIIVMAAVLLVGSVTVALAADGWRTPAEILAPLTGKTPDEVQAARAAGQSYGEQAAAAGKLAAFSGERLEQYKLRLDEAVKEGRITQADADKLYAAMKARVEACDGTCGNTCGGLGAGAGLGRRNGMGNGMGLGMGRMAGGSCGGCFTGN